MSVKLSTEEILNGIKARLNSPAGEISAFEFAYSTFLDGDFLSKRAEFFSPIIDLAKTLPSTYFMRELMLVQAVSEEDYIKFITANPTTDKVMEVVDITFGKGKLLMEAKALKQLVIDYIPKASQKKILYAINMMAAGLSLSNSHRWEPI